jgi:uncharacterized membrane protein
MDLTLPHLHLLLNHFPTIGTIIAIGLYLGAVLRNNDDLRRASLAIFFGLAVVTLPTYMSGNAAKMEIENLPGISKGIIEAHEDAAVLSFIVMELTGAVAWLALWQLRRLSRPLRWQSPVILLLSMLAFALMARTANIGGEIRHPEILISGTNATTVQESAGPALQWLRSASIRSFVIDNTWVWPASETLHFIGLFLLVGVFLLVNLRLLGLMKGIPFAALHRLLPWGILGFALNTTTGMLFFIAAPQQYVHNATFYWKIGFVLLAGAVIFYETVFDEAWDVRAGDAAPLVARVIAASAIACWVGVIYCGQMLPFLGNAF